MSVPHGVQLARQTHCALCPSPCIRYQAGEIAWAAEAEACPIGTWPCWEDCGQEAIPVRLVSVRVPTIRQRALPMPGDVLALAIKAATGAVPCGRCLARRDQMNRWGWWRCWRERATIADWLVEEARSRGHLVEEGRAVELLRAAWRELRARR